MPSTKVCSELSSPPVLFCLFALLLWGYMYSIQLSSLIPSPVSACHKQCGDFFLFCRSRVASLFSKVVMICPRICFSVSCWVTDCCFIWMACDVLLSCLRLGKTPSRVLLQHIILRTMYFVCLICGQGFNNPLSFFHQDLHFSSTF